MRPLLILALVLPASAFANQKVPLSAAMAQCKSLDGPSTVAKANYENCVLAKSGKLPPEKKRKSGITISGSARIGVVVNID